MKALPRRWGKNDNRFGPFLYSRREKSDSYNPFSIVLDSGGGGDDENGCYLRMSACGHTLLIDLPPIIKPWRNWVDCSMYEWSTSPNKGYWDVHSREYGFTVSEGALHVYYGPQTNDSLTTKSLCKFIPWQNWRYIRQSWYGKDGEHIQTLWQSSSREVNRAQSDWRYEFEKTLEKTSFQIKDYDGTLVIVDTKIEEREWRFGEGWFKWLSWFRKPMIRRSLDLSFRHEIGTQKGSWKGGLMGTSIDMLPGELHESAMRRYCEKEHKDKGGKYKITFIGAAS